MRFVILKIPPLLALCFFLAGGLYALPVMAAKKALVIGNNEYQHSYNLANAVNDARDMGSMLSGLGFTTDIVLNGDRSTISRAVNRFADSLGPGDTALFFYSGHGMHARGINYLVPVNAPLNSEEDLEADSLAAEAILQRISDAGPDIGIMLLDACRDNPLKRRSRGLSRGLGLMQVPGGAHGTLIGYAAGIGETADDNEATQRNGLYTGALLSALREPGLTIEDIMKRVRIQVSNESNGKQNPWTLVSLQGEFIPNQPRTGLPPAHSLAQRPAQRPATAGSDEQSTFHPDDKIRRYQHHKTLDSVLDEITENDANTITVTPSAPAPRYHLQKKSGGSLEDFMQDLMKAQ